MLVTLGDLFAQLDQRSVRSFQAATALGGLDGLAFAFFGRPPGALEAQAYLALVGVDAKDLYLELLAGLNDVLGIVHFVIGEFRDVQQAFELLFKLDENTEVGDLGDLALDDLPWEVVVRDDPQPGVLGQLLQAQRDAHLLFVDGQDDALGFVAFGQHLRRMPDLLRPGQVGDVQQPVDPFLYLDKRAEIRHVADNSLDDRSGRVLVLDHGPGVGLGLFHPQRYFLLVLVDIQDDYFDLVADGDHLGGMIDPACPAHLRDMDKTLEALFDFDERAVGHDVDHLPVDVGADRILLLDLVPRTGGLLL